MTVARDIHATVFRNATATFMARVENAVGQAITQASVASVHYTVFELDAVDPTSLMAVIGHDDVVLAASDVIFDTLQSDESWTVDATGYNFRHELDVSSNEAFAKAGGLYQVRYELIAVVGQKIVFRFKLRCI
ncbi:MAG: hypothetical protein KDA57_01000 [Planctomycetales bacterium]|nr:hypothetical protein [Planctomycetales bacterium]